MRITESMMVNAPDSVQTKIKDRHKSLNKKIGELENRFMEPEDVKGYTNEINLSTFLNSTDSYLDSALGDPGQNAHDLLKTTHEEVDKVVTDVNAFIANDWTAYKTFIAGWTWPLFKKVEEVKRD